MRTTLIVASLALLMFGCSSAKEKNENLDIQLDESNNAIEAAMKESDTPNPAGAKGAKLSAENVIHWQNFFKPPPTAKERSVLQKRLSRWKDTESVGQLIKKGRNETALGMLIAAETSFRKVLRLDDDNMDALLELAGLYIKKRQLTKAFELLEEIRNGLNVEGAADNIFIFRYRYTLALGYLATGENKKGHRVLSDLIGIDKAFTPAYTALASSYVSLGKYKIAEFIARRGLDRGKDAPSLYNILGIISQSKREYVTSRTFYNKAIAISKTFAPAYVNRANLSISQYEYEPAEGDLKKALKYDPTNVSALVALGIIQKKTNRIKAARASFTRAIDLDPESALARFNLGVLMVEKLGRPNNALRLFNEVIQISSSKAKISTMAKNYIHDIKNNRAAY